MISSIHSTHLDPRPTADLPSWTPACPLVRKTAQPGDCVILNAPNSTVGRAVLQLARLLKLRTLALLRPPAASPPPPPVNDSQGGVGPARQQGAATDTGDAGGRDEARWRQVAERLVALGATHVLRDEGAIQVGGRPCWVGGGFRGPPARARRRRQAMQPAARQAKGHSLSPPH
jgi:hypothetical protein